MTTDTAARELTATRATRLPQDVAAVRQRLFHEEYPREATDAFDDVSLHVVMRERRAGELAGYGRVTLGGGVFSAICEDDVELPAGAGVADVGRILVTRPYRGIGLLRLVTLELLRCADGGVDTAIGAYILGSPFVPTYFDMGFCDMGPPVRTRPASGALVQLQPIRCDIAATRQRWPAQLARCREKARAHGIAIASPR